ncbi:MAG: ABC transporter substrate-binding protein [Sandaracinaceae bacterium]
MPDGDEHAPTPPWKALGVTVAVSLLAIGLHTAVAHLSDPPPAPPLTLDARAPAEPRVGYFTWGRSPVLDEIERAFVDRLGERDEVRVRVLSHTADFDLDNVEPLIARALATEELDVAVAVTTPLARALHARSGQLPLVFAAITDPVGAGLVPSWENERGSRVTGVSAHCPEDSHLALIQELLPEARRVALLHDTQSELLPPLPFALLEARGLTLVPVRATARGEIPEMVGRIEAARADVVWVHTAWASPEVAFAGFDTLSRLTAERRLPIIASDTLQVRHGALAAQGLDMEAIGTAAAEAVLAILGGQDPGSLPVSRLGCGRPVLDLRRAAQLGVSVPPTLAARAVTQLDDAPPAPSPPEAFLP